MSGETKAQLQARIEDLTAQLKAAKSDENMQKAVEMMKQQQQRIAKLEADIQTLKRGHFGFVENLL